MVHLFVLAAIHFGLLEPKPIIIGAQPLARRETGRRTCFLVSLGLFLNAKEFCQRPFNVRTLLIENKTKCSRPNRPPARSASGLAGGLANIFFPSFGYFSVRKCFFQYCHIHVWARNAFWATCIFGYSKRCISQKFSALSNNPDFKLEK